MEEKISLSTHILDLNLGKPAEGIVVELYKYVEDNMWLKSTETTITDSDGRIKSFHKISDPVGGIYKLKFKTSEYFSNMNVETFYPFVEVRI